jgi:hypothetical protein
LGGLRLGGAPEIFLRYFGDFDRRFGEARPESLSSRRGKKLWSHQSASNLEAGSKQLFNRPYALGDKEGVCLAGFSAPQIARKGKQFHSLGISGSLE